MNTINTKKLDILETAYRRILEYDPFEHWFLTRWIWRKLAAIYEKMDPDF